MTRKAFPLCWMPCKDSRVSIFFFPYFFSTFTTIQCLGFMYSFCLGYFCIIFVHARHFKNTLRCYIFLAILQYISLGLLMLWTATVLFNTLFAENCIWLHLFCSRISDTYCGGFKSKYISVSTCTATSPSWCPHPRNHFCFHTWLTTLISSTECNNAINIGLIL